MIWGGHCKVEFLQHPRLEQRLTCREGAEQNFSAGSCPSAGYLHGTQSSWSVRSPNKPHAPVAQSHLLRMHTHGLAVESHNIAQAAKSEFVTTYCCLNNPLLLEQSPAWNQPADAGRLRCVPRKLLTPL